MMLIVVVSVGNLLRGKGVWPNKVKNRSNVSVRGRRIRDNGQVARVDDDEEDKGRSE